MEALLFLTFSGILRSSALFEVSQASACPCVESSDYETLMGCNERDSQNTRKKTYLKATFVKGKKVKLSLFTS